MQKARFQAEFVWHHHDQEDEMFLVRHGVEHRPQADRNVLESI